MKPAADDIEKYRQRAGLEKVKHTIGLATLRCLGPDEAIAQIARLWEVSDPSALVYRLEETKLTTKQVRAMANALCDLATVGDDLPSREKVKIDRYLLRLSRRLPSHLASNVAGRMLEHPRKSRRQIAYALLRKIGITTRLATRLISMFEATKDEELLHIIAKQPTAVSIVDPRFLLESITEEYWRMRVIESILKTSPAVATALAPDYVREFVWAVGRTEDRSSLGLIRQLCGRSKDHDLLSLYAWALGKLQAQRQLENLARMVDRRLADLRSY